jgi:hypothetical protein
MFTIPVNTHGFMLRGTSRSGATVTGGTTLQNMCATCDTIHIGKQAGNQTASEWEIRDISFTDCSALGLCGARTTGGTAILIDAASSTLGAIGFRIVNVHVKGMFNAIVAANPIRLWEAGRL